MTQTQTTELPVGLSALVVDDDPDINRLIRARLSARGFLVRGAATGEEALTVLAAAPADLIFLDVSMPGMSGLELLERIRADALDLAVIMTTAFGSEQVAIEALRRGADDYLRKPFEASEFQAVVRRTVSRLLLERQNVALRRQLDEKRRQLEQELSRAARVQADLLPHSVPRLPRYGLAARCIPASQVGGDFYDWKLIGGDLLGLAICDVMGKGMPAALMMATVRAMLHTTAGSGGPAKMLATMNSVLASDLDRSEQFVTLFLAHLDLSSDVISYVDAGHGYAAVRRAGGAIEPLRLRGLPLGVLPDEVYQSGTLRLAPGEALVLYSDGLVDARPDQPLTDEQLADTLRDAAGAEDAVARLLALAELERPLPDDLTVVVLWRHDGHQH